MTRAPSDRSLPVERERDAIPIVFLAFANAPGGDPDYLDRLAREYADVRRAFESARSFVHVVDHAAATSDDVFRTFLDPAHRHRVAAFHFAGHADDYALLLRGLSGRQEVAHAGGLAAFLGRQRGLHLVFLNACSTNDQVESLLAAGVPVVVATSTSIADDVAATFARHFYERLTAHDDVATAFDAAAAMTRVQHGGVAVTPAIGHHVDPATAWPWALYESVPGAAAWRLTDASHPCASLPPLHAGRLPSSPFRDLRWFGREHAELFFGRCAETRRLYDLLTEPTYRSDPIVLLYGRSGVGKSSLVEAGLVPRLEASGSLDVRTARRDPTLGLLGTLEAALGATLPRGWIALELETERPLVLVLDQVEEAFTHPLAGPADPGAELDTLVDALARGLGGNDRGPQGKLVLSFGKEWLAEVAERLAQRDLPFTQVFLEPLQRQGVVEAITGPTRTARLRAKYRLTIPDDDADLPGLIADDLLDDVGSPLAPTLQVLLATMWRAATRRDPDAPRFTKALYRDLKRRGVHFGDFLDRRLAAVAERDPDFLETGLALDLLAAHTTPLGMATERDADELMQAYRHRSDLPVLLQALRDESLLVEPPETGRRTATEGAPVDGAHATPIGSGTRLAHDTLAPLVRLRVERSDAPGQRARRILEARAPEWEEGREGAPLDRHDLNTVELGAAGMRAWTEAETRLVAASRRLDRRRQRVAFTAGAALGAGVVVGVTQVVMDVLVGRLDDGPMALSYQLLPNVLAATVWPALLGAALVGSAFLAEAWAVPPSVTVAAAARRRLFTRTHGWVLVAAGAIGFGLVNHVLDSGTGALELAWFTAYGWSSGAALWATLPFSIGLGLGAALRVDLGTGALGPLGRRLALAVASLVVAQAIANLLTSSFARSYAFFLLEPRLFDWGLCTRLQGRWPDASALSCTLLPEAALLGVALMVGLTLGTTWATEPARQAPRERSAP